MEHQRQKVSTLQILCVQNLLNTLHDKGVINKYQKCSGYGAVFEEMELKQKFYDVMEFYLPRRMNMHLFRVMQQINVLNWKWSHQIYPYVLNQWTRIFLTRHYETDSLSLMCAKTIYKNLDMFKRENMLSIAKRLTVKQDFINELTKYIPFYMVIQLIELYERFFLPPIIYKLFCRKCCLCNDQPTVFCKYCKHYLCHFDIEIDIDSGDEVFSD
ncbi:hypothetical protein [Pseudoplusia includens SNPV IE]|uniref:Uncharacterized protein n=1 Tax=Pseudoplusia includens SNPV IE TaxID=1592335 RepID=A0A0B4ZUP2_9ABAC|nr:hypothetical protein [Pseudoplusia includens SNPV IE]AJD80801.1 hypothetical protein [Pseudoplusia includens SNPV IE]